MEPKILGTLLIGTREKDPGFGKLPNQAWNTTMHLSKKDKYLQGAVLGFMLVRGLGFKA